MNVSRVLHLCCLRLQCATLRHGTPAVTVVHSPQPAASAEQCLARQLTSPSKRSRACHHPGAMPVRQVGAHHQSCHAENQPATNQLLGLACTAVMPMQACSTVQGACMPRHKPSHQHPHTAVMGQCVSKFSDRHQPCRRLPCPCRPSPSRPCPRARPYPCRLRRHHCHPVAAGAPDRPGAAAAALHPGGCWQPRRWLWWQLLQPAARRWPWRLVVQLPRALQAQLVRQRQPWEPAP